MPDHSNRREPIPHKEQQEYRDDKNDTVFADPDKIINGVISVERIVSLKLLRTSPTFTGEIHNALKPVDKLLIKISIEVSENPYAMFCEIASRHLGLTMDEFLKLEERLRAKK